jgi:glycosyltransferase involved in cell wall biosynthesis
MTAPIVSVLLPVRNGGDLLPLAVESILSQQGVDFELIVIDDGSDDGTPAYLAGIADPRLRVVRRAGEGIVVALNAGFAMARGRYIARMDGDDIALPGRLAAQAHVLDTEPDADITFTSAHVIDAQGQRNSLLLAEAKSRDEQRAILLEETRGAPIIHPSVMMRRSVLEALGGYRAVPLAEDHDLWLRAVDRFGFRAIPQALLEYRHHIGGVSRHRAVEQAVSCLLNNACYRLQTSTGIDLFLRAPQVHAALRLWIAEHLGDDLRAISQARAIRSELKRGRRLKGAFDLLRFALRDARLLSDSGMRARLIAGQHRAVRAGLSLLHDAEA